MKKNKDFINFIFPNNKAFSLTFSSAEDYGWTMVAPEYKCQVKSLKEGLYLLTKSYPKRFATNDFVGITVNSQRGVDEFCLIPRRNPYSPAVAYWDLVNKRLDYQQKFNFFDRAVYFFDDLNAIRDKIFIFKDKAPDLIIE